MGKSEAVTKHRQKRRTELVQIMGGKCALCGYDKSIAALELHHINPKEKEFALSAGGTCRSIEKDVEEAKKCILVCANCHREIHNGLKKDLVSSFNQEIADEIIASYKREKEKPRCIRCGKEIQGKLYCAECAIKERKEESARIRPSRDELKDMIRTQSFVSIGNKYGVSDNAIRKWCDAYNLPRKKTTINSYTDDQWSKI